MKVMGDFLEFERAELDFKQKPDGEYKQVAIGAGHIGIRKTTIDRVEPSLDGTVILTCNTAGKGPMWSICVFADFDNLMREVGQ